MFYLIALCLVLFYWFTAHLVHDGMRFAWYDGTPESIHNAKTIAVIAGIFWPIALVVMFIITITRDDDHAW